MTEKPQDKSFSIRSREPDGSKTAYRYQVKVTYEEQENTSDKNQSNKHKNNVKD